VELEATAADADDAPLIQAYATFCTPSRQASAREEIAQIEAAFDALPADYQEVIRLAFLVRLPHRQIAERMQRSEVAVRKLLSRARARLAVLAAGGSRSS
jgi:RNA polymerase sigma factor (sigma-70 family)